MFLEAGGDAADLLELAEISLEQIAAAVEVGRDAALLADAATGRDVRLSAARGHPFDQGKAVMAAVGDDDPGRQGARQRRGCRLVRGLAWRDVQPDRQPALLQIFVSHAAKFRVALHPMRPKRIHVRVIPSRPIQHQKGQSSLCPNMHHNMQ